MTPSTLLIKPTVESIQNQKPARMGIIRSIVTWLDYQVRATFAFAFSSSAKADWIFKTIQQEKLNVTLIIHANSAVFEKLGNLSTALTDTVSKVALLTLGIAKTIARSEKTKTMIQTLSQRIQESQKDTAVHTDPISYPQLEASSSKSSSESSSSSSGASSSSSDSETEETSSTEASASTEKKEEPGKPGPEEPDEPSPIETQHRGLFSSLLNLRASNISAKGGKIEKHKQKIKGLEKQLQDLRTETGEETAYQTYNTTCQKLQEAARTVRERQNTANQVESPKWAKKNLKTTKEHGADPLKEAKAAEKSLKKELNNTEYAKLEQALKKLQKSLQKLESPPKARASLFPRVSPSHIRKTSPKDPFN